VRLARVSCGATLPIPGCLQDCNIVSGTEEGEGEGKRGRVAITIRSRSHLVSRALFSSFSRSSLSPSRFLVVYFHARSLFSVSRAECHGANCE